MAGVHRTSACVRQRGAVLLFVLIALFLISTAFWLRSIGQVSTPAQRDARTAAALAQAKEALIGRAVVDASRPGSLPCPDVDGDGSSPLMSGNKCPSYIGRLPWKTLDIPEPVDGNGDGLWYALAPGLRDHPDAIPINSSKTLELSLDTLTNVAAIVFSAGPALAGQTGRPSNKPADYLDDVNAGGDTAYVSHAASAAFNDRALAITHDDLFRVVDLRVLGEIRGPDDNSPSLPKYGLRSYYAGNGSFPWADSDGDGHGDTGVTSGKLPYNDLTLNPNLLKDAEDTAWLKNNAWLPLVKYQRLSANSVRISIDSSTMVVTPCPMSPCP